MALQQVYCSLFHWGQKSGMNNLSISHTVVIWYCGFSSTCDVSVPWLHTKQPRSTVCCMLLYTAFKDSMHQAKILMRLACASALCRTKQHLCPCFISFNGRKVIGQTQTNKGASMNLKHIKCNLKTGRRWRATSIVRRFRPPMWASQTLPSWIAALLAWIKWVTTTI